MSTSATENHALQRLSAITWNAGDDGYLTMEGRFTPAGAQSLLQQLGEEGTEALGLVFIAAHTKAVMKRSSAEAVFRIEGLPLRIHEHVRAL
jgi:hypothetical protein